MGKKFYECLGVSENATDDDIQKAYHWIKLKYHLKMSKSPMTEEMFKLVVEAYEVLSNKEKRKIYDCFGEEGLKSGELGSEKKNSNSNYSSTHHNNSYTFSQTFEKDSSSFSSFGRNSNSASHSFTKDNPHFGQAVPPKQRPPIEHDLYVDPEDLQIGCRKKMKISRQVLRPDGITTRKEDKILTVNIKPWWKVGTRITFQREGDQGPNVIPEDIVFIIKEKKHPGFKRKYSEKQDSQWKDSGKQDPPIEHYLYVTLEDVLTGGIKKMKVNRKVLNPDGITTRKEDKILRVDIKPGSKAGTRITFPREGDQGPNVIPADIAFILKDKPHPYFKRENSDILYTYQLSLREFLYSEEIEIPTLTDEKIKFRTTDLTKPNSTRRLVGRGLPDPEDPNKRGDLIVTFKPTFPDNL